MRDVDQYARFIHFADDLFPERTETVPFRVSSCRVAQVVAPIVAESNIGYTHFTETDDILDVLAYRVPVFHTQHDCFLSGRFQRVDFLWRAGDAHAGTVQLHLPVYFLQAVHGEVCRLQQ